MKLKDLSPVLFSRTGSIQMAILYDRARDEDVAHGSVDYIVANYPEAVVRRITADADTLIITI